MGTRATYTMYILEKKINEIDKMIVTGTYKSRSEFVEQAIANLLEYLKREESQLGEEAYEALYEKEKKKAHTFYLDIEIVQELDRYVRRNRFKSRTDAVNKAIDLLLQKLKEKK